MKISRTFLECRYGRRYNRIVEHLQMTPVLLLFGENSFFEKVEKAMIFQTPRHIGRNIQY